MINENSHFGTSRDHVILHAIFFSYVAHYSLRKTVGKSVTDSGYAYVTQ